MTRSSLSVVSAALAVVAGCGGPAVDIAIVGVFDTDNKQVQAMPSEREMAFKATKLAVLPVSSGRDPYLQEEAAGVLRGLVGPLPGVEVVNTEAEADWVLRPEITDARTSVRKTGDDTSPKWQLNARAQGKIKIIERRTRTPTEITLNGSTNKSFGTQAESESSSNKSSALKTAVRSAVNGQKSALKRKFPMHMYIFETKGACKYVNLNRGRIHKVQKAQKLSLLDSKTGQTVPGYVKVFQIDEETSWAESDESARVGVKIGLKCLPAGR